jgi:hypothetical protein
MLGWRAFDPLDQWGPRVSFACPAPIASLAPDLCRAVDIYCERTSAAFDAEPLNAISNAAFLVAAAAAWRLQSRNPNAATDAFVRALCLIIAIVGIGSFTFHTIATRWASWADVIPILVFMLAYCWLLLTVFFGWHWVWKLITLALFFAATFHLEAESYDNLLWGGAMYLPTLIAMLVFGVALIRRHAAAGRAFFIAAGVFLLSFTARTIDMPLCPALPIGTHYFWHIFNATVLYLLVRVVILYAPGEQAARTP